MAGTGVEVLVGVTLAVEVGRAVGGAGVAVTVLTETIRVTGGSGVGDAGAAAGAQRDNSASAASGQACLREAGRQRRMDGPAPSRKPQRRSPQRLGQQNANQANDDAEVQQQVAVAEPAQI